VRGRHRGRGHLRHDHRPLDGACTATATAWSRQVQQHHRRRRVALWWDHLRRAGFVSGVGDKQPFNALSGQIGVQTGDSAGAAALGGFAGIIICSANLPDKIAIAADTQMDDGVSETGTVRAVSQTAPNPTSCADDVRPRYAETGTNLYTLCRAL
jgi:hypothetical protein